VLSDADLARAWAVIAMIVIVGGYSLTLAFAQASMRRRRAGGAPTEPEPGDR
jgi:hypothetical protein